MRQIEEVERASLVWRLEQQGLPRVFTFGGAVDWADKSTNATATLKTRA